MEREMERLRTSLKDIKERKRGEQSPSFRRRRKEQSPKEDWPPLGERDGSQSAPAVPSGREHDAGAFLLQQIEETFERLLSQKLRFLDPMKVVPLGIGDRSVMGVEESLPMARRNGKEMGGEVEPPTDPVVFSLLPPLSRKKGKKGGKKGNVEGEEAKVSRSPSTRDISRAYGEKKGGGMAGKVQPPPSKGRKDGGRQGIPAYPPSQRSSPPMKTGNSRLVVADDREKKKGVGNPGKVKKDRGIPAYPLSQQLPPQGPGETWSTVVGKREKKGVGEPREEEGNGSASGRQSSSRWTGEGEEAPGYAITIDVKEGGYGDIIKTARRAIGERALRDMGIEVLRTRKSLTGLKSREVRGSKWRPGLMP